MLYLKIKVSRGCHSSVDSSAPTILRFQVRILSTLFMRFPFMVKYVTIFVTVLSIDENKQKEVGLIEVANVVRLCTIRLVRLLVNHSYRFCS